MSADTRSSRRISAPVALLFAVNAATQFAIQAWLAYGFAAHVWKLAQPLPWFAPLALDVFAVTLMAAAYILRQAPLRQRAYVWFWLGVAIGAQVGASEGFADHERWGWWGRFASLFPAVFLAASLHALIIVARKADAVPLPSDAPAREGWWARRKANRALARALKADRKRGEQDPPPPAGKPQTRAIDGHHAASRDLGTNPPAATPPAVPEAAPPAVPAALPAAPAPRRRQPARSTQPGAGRGRPGNPLRPVVVKRVIQGGEDAKTVALELGLNPRTAQLWVAAAREATSRDVSPERSNVVKLQGRETGPDGASPPMGRQDRFQ